MDLMFSYEFNYFKQRNIGYIIAIAITVLYYYGTHSLGVTYWPSALEYMN